MNSPHLLTRRGFLLQTGAVGLLAQLGRLHALAQAAQPAAQDYKALVCIFMVGGNDGHGMLIPQSGTGPADYAKARGPIALPDSNGALLPVTSRDGQGYALNAGLAALHPYWAQGQLAVLANVGMLSNPLTRAQYLSRSARVPTNLFSHSDQIQQMQSGFPSATGGSGWGGRVADAVQKAYNGTATFPTNCSIAGPALFCTGQSIQAAALLPGFNLGAEGMALWPPAAASARAAGLQQVLQFDSGLRLVQEANMTRQDALDLNALLRSGATTVTSPFPQTSLGQQLQQVASVINLRQATGMRRQVFFCSLGGFDTHSGQNWQQFDLLRQLAQALAAFYQYTADSSIAGQVTSFTLSDFGRTLQPSGSGTDHGWGSHHLILGGAVRGGNVYGTFPSLRLGGEDDAGGRGVLIPTTAVAQYGATLASWFGVDDPSQVFENLALFPQANLGFLT